MGEVAVLKPAPDVPDPPGELGQAGRDLWFRAWGAAIIWLAPESDWSAVVRAARLADAEAVALAKYLATHESADARAYVQVSGEYGKALSSLGFTPTDRARLGVAEVKAQSELERVLAARSARGQGSASGG